jgi:uncharacterized membrane protein
MLFSIMHIIHLLAVVLWIGGLAFVTAIILPMILRNPDALGKVLLFRGVERRFAKWAKALNLVTGMSGFMMIFIMVGNNVAGGRAMLTRPGLPLSIMALIWLFWFVMLFGLEPIIIKKMLDKMARDAEGGGGLEIDAVFRRMRGMHWVLLLLSLVAIASGAIFAHGPIFF